FTRGAVSLTVGKLGSGTGTLTSTTGGIACGAVCTFSYVIGSTLTLTATSDAGVIFGGLGRRVQRQRYDAIVHVGARREHAGHGSLLTGLYRSDGHGWRERDQGRGHHRPPQCDRQRSLALECTGHPVEDNRRRRDRQ